MSNKKKLFSHVKTYKHDEYRFFGIKFTTKSKCYREESKASMIIQDTLDLTRLINSKKIIVFLTPKDCKICGGVMSIFSLCQASREIVKDAYCLISTYPNNETYVINDKFYNNEKVLRFEQIVNNAKKVQDLIIHIPDYYADDFYKALKKKDIEFLKSVPNLQLNIMNQNIECMPEPEELKDLYKLTNNITQTIAHNSYATQEVCNKWNMPTHLFSVNLDLSKYKNYTFEEKDKIIVLSPDKHKMKESIVEKIEHTFKDWEIITVKEMSFTQYMDLIGRAYFTITFGEGMDGYFNQPIYVGGLGFAVYNDDFFPNESWKDLKNVYSSYEEMSEKICDDMKELSINKDLYHQTIQEQLQKLNEIYTNNGYVSNIERFYKKEYDFVPTNESKKEIDNDFVAV